MDISIIIFDLFLSDNFDSNIKLNKISNKFNDEYDEFLKSFTKFSNLLTDSFLSIKKFQILLMNSLFICPDISSNVLIFNSSSIKAVLSSKLIDSLRSPFVIVFNLVIKSFETLIFSNLQIFLTIISKDSVDIL